ncbi:MltG/YceG/YrrL family protein [Calidifontibacillus oryziterrae]|uniref:endolytic transglycosylase MltG n=1 Tax=Calidifontibacillus oryziterrae TaxID=1191699 RepID=UPI00031A7298|nr:endolytic transglycosylase MltG [Calidifontibacillus oryziterrae]
MDKHTARGIAIGLFISAILLIVFKPIFAFDSSNTVSKDTLLDQDTITSFLEENNLVVISKEELANIDQNEPNTPQENGKAENEPTLIVSDNDKELDQQISKDKQEKEENKPEDKLFTITKGMVSSEVAYQLKKSGLIKHQGDFIKTLESKNGAKYIQVGEYKLNSSMNNDEIISVITRNRV